MMDVADIGGAVVRRRISRSAGDYSAGQKLSREQVLSMPIGNLRALVDAGYIELCRSTGDLGTYHMVHTGGGKYNVVRGHLMNDAPLTKQQAEAMCGIEAAQAA